MVIVNNGATDVTMYFVLRDSTAHSPKTDVTVTDIDLYYVEERAAISAKIDCSALAAANSAHTDGGAFNVGQGMYRIDWPDAAFDGGVGKRVNLIVVCAGVDTTYFEVVLSPAVNVTYHGGVAVAAATAAGYVQVDILSVVGDADAGGGLLVMGQRYYYDGGIDLRDDNNSKQVVRDAMKLAPTAGDPDAGSVDKHLDDILTATAACASVAANSTDATASGAITRKRGNSWSIALTLGEVTGYTSLWFTIKRSVDDADGAALLQVKLNSPSAADGLLYVNGAAATNAALASITVSDASTGAIVVAVDETVTDDLYPGSYYYDAQMLNTGAVTTPDSGTFTITADVTRSVA